MTGRRWTEESTKQLKQLWQEGLSASTISFRLDHYISRSAVLGKVHRLNLSSRKNLVRTPCRNKTPEEQKHFRELRAARAYAKAHSPSLAPINGKVRHMKPCLWKTRHAPPVARVAYEGEPITVLEFTSRRCKYAVTDTKPYLFCGAPSHGPWCEEHRARVYRRVDAMKGEG